MNGEWRGIEIKLGTNQTDKAAENLTKINESIKIMAGSRPNHYALYVGWPMPHTKGMMAFTWPRSRH